MKYQVAEKFKSLQGEGVYAGTPMAFIRFTGCSVGKRVCHACDTDFDQTYPWRGGGEFEDDELVDWSSPYDHVCLTGGEPLDQNLSDLLDTFKHRVIDPSSKYMDPMVHIETSGTKDFGCFDDREKLPKLWICVSPKPGYIEDMVMRADEVKVIVPGLGNGPGWPQLEDALRWANMDKIVYLQPRNAKFDVDKQQLLYVTDLLRDHPSLRLSVQMHKILKVQ